MVAQFSNTEFFSLMFNDDFSEEKIQKYEASLDTLGHIYVHSIDRNNISHENLKKLYERIYLKRKNLKLVLPIYQFLTLKKQQNSKIFLI